MPAFQDLPLTNLKSFTPTLLQEEQLLFPDGLPMGDPSSSLLANWTVAAFEDFLFSNNSSNPLGFWFRNADDIFCVWKGTRIQLDSFLSTLLSSSQILS